jgi:hypothetical protein
VEVRDPDSLRVLKKRMALANVTHVVLSTSRAEMAVGSDPDFAFLQRIGRFSVYQFRDGRTHLVLTEGPIFATAQRTGSGHIRVLTNSVQGGTLLLAEAYHPFWAVRGVSDAHLEMTDYGLMRLSVPGGMFEISLDYASPRLPVFMSVAVWISLGLAWLWSSPHHHSTRKTVSRM